MAEDDEARAQVRKDFAEAVNMTPAALEKWLETDDSKAVGWKGEDGKGAGESVGHKSGEHIVAIKRKTQAELDAGDYAHMKKVVGYVRRHMAQRPEGDVTETRWRHSLMNWGHDPLKK